MPWHRAKNRQRKITKIIVFYTFLFLKRYFLINETSLELLTFNDFIVEPNFSLLLMILLILNHHKCL